ncbi:hypothetical protein [Helicobacter macacae]|uniref:hypothetical protein n=1 Tax=Helicobacter macacae TaxID=398626 RepID=UPI0011DDD850|nr:hypothetical protein [Helicobacter macacae]
MGIFWLSKNRKNSSLPKKLHHAVIARLDEVKSWQSIFDSRNDDKDSPPLRVRASKLFPPSIAGRHNV